MVDFIAKEDEIENLANQIVKFKNDLSDLIEYIHNGDHLRWDIAKYNFNFRDIKEQQDSLIDVIDNLCNDMMNDCVIFWHLVNL